MSRADPDDPHAPRLTVDLGALRANWRLLRDRAAGAECAAAVKADAYGHGLPEVVRALYAAGCRTFFVAHLAEAARARAAAPDATLYVLNGLPPGAAGGYAPLGARPVLGSAAEVAEWRAAGGGPCALHVDTGINRLGLRSEALASLDLTGVDARLLMSHLASAEDPADPLTAAQVAAFDRARALLPHLPASLCNSSGLFLSPVPAHAMVRPGYALYGGNPTPGRANPVRAVARVEATILQVRVVEDGERVGYNGAWTAQGRRRLAVLSAGYADGLPRALSSADRRPGGVVLIGGVPCPVAGRVSMDLLAVDATDAPEGAAVRGGPAVLLGDGVGVDEVAAMAGTNGYEVLTRLGARAARTYVGRE